ncbi:MAG: SIR2 family NAD-dependent protein deacylase [Promethearchaeota archaeon]
MDEAQFSRAVEILRGSEYVVAFTGAGASTESGISDFRSPGGIWSRYDPNLYANYHVFLERPHLYWELALELTPAVFAAKPNPGHLALVDLEKQGKLRAIITQNIDTLHQRAGSEVPVLELHGTYGHCTCLECGKEFSRLDVVERVRNGERVPRCTCGGLIKSGAVLFGEPMPLRVVDEAYEHARRSDCFVVIGSSLVVSPANQMPIVAKSSGARLIIVNRDPTHLDHLADVVLRGKSGDILPKLVHPWRE